MNPIKQGVWLISTCALFAYFCFSFLKVQTAYKLDANALSTTVDTVITNLTVYQFDETGELTHHLFTPKMQHTPQNNRHALQSPRIVIKQPNEPDWKIESNHADAIHGGKKITFLGNVIVHQDEKGNTLNTEELTYYTSKKLATSSLPVRFKQPGSTVHSTGMRAYLDRKYIQLLSQSHATFEPNDA